MENATDASALPTGRAALAPIGDPDPSCIGGYYEKGSDPNGSLPFLGESQ